MACKNSIPARKCIDCQYLNHEAYRGLGLSVCYEEKKDDRGNKVAVTKKLDEKACNKFIKGKKLSIAN